MQIKELNQRCGECEIIEHCGNAFGYCICTDSRFQEMSEAEYAEIAEQAEFKEFKKCEGCFEECMGCENEEEEREYRSKQIADFVEKRTVRNNLNKVAIYFEIFGLAVDEYGNPDYAGMKLTLGSIEEKIDYKELTKDINIKGILEMAMLDKIVEEKDTRIITPEEYREKYEEVEK